MSDLPTTILVATGGSADSVEAARRAQETTCGTRAYARRVLELSTFTSRPLAST